MIIFYNFTFHGFYFVKYFQNSVFFQQKIEDQLILKGIDHNS